MTWWQTILGIIDKALSLKLRKKPSELGKLIIETRKKVEALKNDIQKNIQKQHKADSTAELTALERDRVSLEGQRTVRLAELGQAILDSGWDGNTD